VAFLSLITKTELLIVSLNELILTFVFNFVYFFNKFKLMAFNCYDKREFKSMNFIFEFTQQFYAFRQIKLTK